MANNILSVAEKIKSHMKNGYKFFLEELAKIRSGRYIVCVGGGGRQIMEFYETQKWKKMIAEAQEHAIRTGGGGSNMAEPLYFKPGPVIPDDLPPEEIARRKKALEEMQKIVDRVAARVEAASD